jgi:hypothetical protein
MEIKTEISDYNITNMNDIFKQLGHELNEEFKDDFDHTVKLQLYKGYLAYVYTDVQIKDEDFAEYAKGSSFLSAIGDVVQNLPTNISEKYMDSIFKLSTQYKQQGTLKLRKFIVRVRQDYNLHRKTDYNGDLFFIPIFQIMAKPENAKGD